MALTPKFRKTTQVPFSVDELEGSEDGSDEVMLADEIAKLQKTVQRSQRERRQLDLRLEGLEHDLACADKARELGNQAAVSVVRRLAGLFGEALKDEDLVPKVQALQERARLAHEEAESLRTHLASLRLSSPMAQRETTRELDAATSDIDGAKMEEQRLISQMSKIDEEIQRRQNDLNRVENEVRLLSSRFSGAVGSNSCNSSDIIDKIQRNSDEFLHEQCARVASSMGISFDPRITVPEFVEELGQRIVDLRNEVAPGDAGDARFADVSEQVRRAMTELDEVTANLKRLERERKSAKRRTQNFQGTTPENYTPEINSETRQQEGRTRKLRHALHKALSILGYDWHVPTSHQDICSMYRKLAKVMQEEISNLEAREEPQPDLTVLMSKVSSVRRQNRELRRRIRNG